MLRYANKRVYYLFEAGYLTISLLDDNLNTADLLLLFAANNFVHVITQHSRTALFTSTLIDLFITNYEKKKVKTGVLSSGISDHLPIFMRVPTKREARKRDSTTLNFENITPPALDNFRKKLMTTNWADLFHSVDMNIAYYTFFLNI